MTPPASFAELDGILASLPADTFVVGFFIGHGQVSQDEWMNPLAKCLRSHGFFTVGLLTQENLATSGFDQTDVVAVIDREQLAGLARINVLVISDLEGALAYPAQTRVLGCVHALETASAHPMQMQLSSIRAMDGLMVPFPIAPQTRDEIRALWTGFHSPEHINRKSRNFYIIPVGYPRLAALSQSLADSKVIPDSIVYAPLTAGFALELGGQRIKKYGAAIIRVLLANFPTKKVIFRPYKDNLHLQLVTDICERFSSEDRFILDANPDKNFSFSHGQLLITDISHIAKSFAFSTLRPSIYFMPWEKQERLFSNWAGGHITHTFTGLIRAIRTILTGGNNYAQKIRERRASILMPFENAFDEIAGWLRDFYDDNPDDNWLTIERNNPLLMQSDIEIIAKTLDHPLTSIPNTGAEAASFRMPPSPLMIAYALHVGMLATPDTWLLCYLRQRTGEYLHITFEAKNYSDVEPSVVRKLYSLSLLDYLKKGDNQGKELVERLILQFDERFQ